MFFYYSGNQNIKYLFTLNKVIKSDKQLIICS